MLSETTLIYAFAYLGEKKQELVKKLFKVDFELFETKKKLEMIRELVDKRSALPESLQILSDEFLVSEDEFLNSEYQILLNSEVGLTKLQEKLTRQKFLVNKQLDDLKELDVRNAQ